MKELRTKDFIIIGTFIIFLIFLLSVNYKNKNINLVSGLDWSHFPGATVSDRGIYFKPLGREIVHSDGSVGQLNPPLNLNSHIEIDGDFKITFSLSEIDNQASFRLYSKPPIIYDEWRYESPSVDINFDAVKNIITVRIWNGISSGPTDMRVYDVSIESKVDITFEYTENQIIFFKNGRVLGSIPNHDIFESGQIWFGADSTILGRGWTLSKLNIQSLNGGSVRLIQAPSFDLGKSNPDSLRYLAGINFRKIKIGSAISIGRLFADEQYRNLVLSQFSIMTPENSMKPQFIHPQPNVYVFEESDQLVDIALMNDMKVHGHTLVYAKSSPLWMTKSRREDRQKIMVDHIEKVVNHFKGRVSEWDVVNEVFSKKNVLYKNWGTGLDHNIWFDAMGENYIDLAFETAHKADPQAKLYLNDYGVERDGQHWEALLALVKRLKQRNVPIDGVGFQAHVYNDGDYFDANQLKNHMDVLAELGLLVRISEIDVTGDDAQEQINQYVLALDVCLKASNCTSYTTWGSTDLYGSTTRSDRYPLVYGTSLLWDKDMKPKPAYKALQERLRRSY
jgi:endo-1,4-beta-xylanase